MMTRHSNTRYTRKFNPHSFVLCLLFLTTLFVIVGCKEPQKDMNILADVVQIEPNVLIPHYSSKALDVTGGLVAWKNTKKFEFDSIVTFYKADGSYYLTEQHYEIYPWLNSIRISAKEPEGNLDWQLLRAPSTSKKTTSWHTGHGLPVELCAKQCFVEAILDITTAPVRFLDRPLQFAEAAEPIKINSRWYHLIERNVPVDPQLALGQYWSNAVFYQNKDDSLIEMVWFPDVDLNESKCGLLVHGYDYLRVEPAGKPEAKASGVYIPSRIELSETDTAGNFRRRLVRIELIEK